MQFESKQSSSIHSASYDPAHAHLSVSFKGKNGSLASTYSYFGVSQKQWEAFSEAESKGKHFAAHIRGKFLS